MTNTKIVKTKIIISRYSCIQLEESNYMDRNANNSHATLFKFSTLYISVKKMLSNDLYYLH